MNNKINCKDITFIIPVKIESDDRLNNAKFTLNFLYESLDTNLIIYEAGSSKIPEIFDTKRENIKYIQKDLKDNEPFHRTRYLNEMLKMVKTPIVSNYDVDVILDFEVYEKIQTLMFENSIDLLFPFGFGSFQKQVHQNFHIHNNKNIFKNTKDLYNNLNLFSQIYLAEYGHCQFFKTKSYISGGMENEKFISYAPEDKERYARFYKLGYKVGRLNKNFVYHLEHSRSLDSNASNPYFQKNMSLWDEIQNMSVFELVNYYKN